MDVETKNQTDSDQDDYDFVNNPDPEDHEPTNNEPNQNDADNNKEGVQSQSAPINQKTGFDEQPIKTKGAYNLDSLLEGAENEAKANDSKPKSSKNSHRSSSKSPMRNSQRNSQKDFNSKGSEENTDPNIEDPQVAIEQVKGKSRKNSLLAEENTSNNADQFSTAPTESNNQTATSPEIKQQASAEKEEDPNEQEPYETAQFGGFKKKPQDAEEDEEEKADEVIAEPTTTTTAQKKVRRVLNDDTILDEDLTDVNKTTEKSTPSYEDERPIKGATETFSKINEEDERPIKPMGNKNLMLDEEQPPQKEEKKSDSAADAIKDEQEEAKRPTDEEQAATTNNNNAIEDERPLGGNSRGAYQLPDIDAGANPIDEIPIGGGSNDFNAKLDAMNLDGIDPFGGKNPATNPSKGAAGSDDSGPLSDRVKSKLFKTRQNAFAELAEEFKKADPSEPVFSEYASGFAKFIADTNPAAQEKALEALQAFLAKAENTTGFETKAVLKVVCDKGIGPGKPHIKKIAFDVVCYCFEKCQKQDVFDGVLDSINSKNQKTQCAGVQALCELLVNYGAKKLDYLKPFFASIEKLAGSTSSPLRTEAMNFYKECFRHMGEALKPFLNKLKKAQQEELEKFWEESPKILAKPLKGGGTVTPIQSKGGDAAAASGQQKEDDMGGDAPLDPYDISDPVDIFGKYNEGWADKVLNREKWHEKRDMLEEFLTAANVPKLANVPIQHITSMAKKLLNDNNVFVMICSIKIYGALAKGLRKNFSVPCKLIMPFLLPKLKDKKGPVIEETGKTLDKFVYCITPDDVLDDITQALNDKLGSYKIHVLGWLERYFEKDGPAKGLSTFKKLSSNYKKLLEDSSVEVRDRATKCLAKLQTIYGEEKLTSALGDIKSGKLGKINDMAENMNEDSNTSSSLPPPSSSRRRVQLGSGEYNSNSQSAIIEEDKQNTNRPGTSKGADSRKQTMFSRPGTAKPGMQKGGSVKNLNKSLNSDAMVGEDQQQSVGTLTNDEAEARLVQIGVPDSVLTGLGNNNWKQKNEAIGELKQWIKDNTESCANSVDHIFKILKKNLKDWKESNLNILKETFSLILDILENEGLNLNKRAFSILALFITNNIGDVKYSENCKKIVQGFVEVVNPKSIIHSLLSNALDSKNPKNSNPKSLIELCNLLARLIEDLTLKFFPLKETIDYGKFAASNSNQNVRTAAQGLFVAIYTQMGAPLNDMISDINPSTLKIIQGEFEKVVPLKNAECKIKFRGEAQQETKNEANSNPLDSLPRADISQEANKLIKKLSDKDWKVRNEAIESLDQILTQSHNRIQTNGLYEFVNVLKTRLNDNNKSQLKLVLPFIGKFGAAMGPGAKTYAKIILPELLRNLSDKQSAVRNEVLAALDKWAKEVKNETIVSLALPMLSIESPEMRTEVINWILRNPDGLVKNDIKQSISPILSALQDKNKEIRSLTEKLIEACAAIVGTQPFLTAIKDLRTAIQNTLRPIIEKYSAASAGEQGEMDVENSTLNGSLERSRSSSNIRRSSGGDSSSSNQMKNQLNKSKTTINNFASVGNQSSNAPLSSDGRSNSVNRQQTKPGGGIPGGNMMGGKSNSSNNLLQENVASGISTNVTSGTNSLAPSPSSNMILSFLKEKGLRQEEELRWPWLITEVRDDMVERLKDHLRRNVHPDLYAKLFSYEIKKNQAGITLLKKAMTTEFAGTVEVADLIFRWMFVKLFDCSNSEIIKDCLDYLISLFIALENAQYVLLDCEAEVLLATFIEKLGFHSSLKSRFLKFFAKFGGVFPPQRVAQSLMLGMNSKNRNTRVECIEILSCLVREFRANILNQKDIRLFGKLLGYNDSGIQQACMNVLLEIGLQIGTDQVVHMITGVASAQAIQVFQERIQSYANEAKTYDSISPAKDSDLGLYHPSSPEKIKLGKTPTKFPFQTGTAQNRNHSPVKSKSPVRGGGHQQSSTPRKSASPVPNQNKRAVSQNGRAKSPSPAPRQNKASPPKNATPTQQQKGGAAPQQNNMGNFNQMQQQQQQQFQQLQPQGQQQFPMHQRNLSQITEEQSQAGDDHTQVTGSEELSQSVRSSNTHQTQARDQQSVISELKNFTSKTSVVSGDLFERAIDLLVNGNISNRLDTLYFFHEVATSENEMNKQYIRQNANVLMHAIHNVFTYIFEADKSEVPIKFVFYFLNMTHKLCSIRNFLKNVTEENLRNFADEMLTRLLAEDEHKTFENHENESLVKTLNSTMLRILENSNPNDMFCILFDLLIKNRRQHTYAKILGLIIKCILKLTKALEQLSQVIQPEKILLRSHLYLVEFATDSSRMGDDIGIKTIKTILNELVKLYGDRIWQFYGQSVQPHEAEDQYIQRWIGVILRPVGQNNQSHLSPRFANPITIPGGNGAQQQQSNQSMNMSLNMSMNQQQQQQQQQQNDSQQQQQYPNFQDLQEIRNVITGIKNGQNFEQAIVVLHQILSQHPEQELNYYLKDYNHGFGEYIVDALEHYRKSQNQMNSSGQNFNNNNQQSNNDFNNQQQQQQQGLQQQQQQQRQGPLQTRYSLLRPTMQSMRQSQQQQQQQNQSLNESMEQIETIKNINSQAQNGGDFQEFHNKVNNLKARYGFIMKSDNPNVSTTNNQQDASPNNTSNINLDNSMNKQSQNQNSQVGITGMKILNNSNLNVVNQIKEPESLKERRSSMNQQAAANNGGNAGPKSTENILQKLSEMKMRMANIVNNGANKVGQVSNSGDSTPAQN